MASLLCIVAIGRALSNRGACEERRRRCGRICSCSTAQGNLRVLPRKLKLRIGLLSLYCASGARANRKPRERVSSHKFKPQLSRPRESSLAASAPLKTVVTAPPSHQLAASPAPHAPAQPGR
jgi:hypothetical protein